MAKVVTPKVFLIAETRIEPSHRAKFLAELGVPDWKTDAETDAEELMEIAGKSCYLSFDTSLNKNLTRTGTRNNRDYLQDGIIRVKHGSVLEHATVTLAFVNVSRVFTHELVRHRVGAAYSQVSGRYVRTDEINYYLPREFGVGATAIMQAAFMKMEEMVKTLTAELGLDQLTDFNLKKRLTSAVRRIIGNGQANHIIATFNHRTLRHIIEQRTSLGAEEEMRVVFNIVARMMVHRYPAIYADLHEVDEAAGLSAFEFGSEKV